MEIISYNELPSKIKHKYVIQAWNRMSNKFGQLILFNVSECRIVLKYLMLRNYGNIFIWKVLNGSLDRNKDITNNLEILKKEELNNLWK